MTRCVHTKELTVLDDGFFNSNRFNEWYNLLLEFAGATIYILREETGFVSGFSYEINQVLLKEVVYDAMVGLKTVVVSENNEVEKPNPFKIAAYLGYWFLQHKPIIFRVDPKFDIDKVEFPSDVDEAQRKEIINDMKHLNELAVTRFLLRYIFVVEGKAVCSRRSYSRVKRKSPIYFDGYEEMFSAVAEKLRYHLTYRLISPKIIEHFLEAYTLHPYLPYTCDIWSTEE